MTTQPDASLESAFSKLNIADEDHELIASLHRLSAKAPKLVKSTEYAAPADPNVMIRSWKMNEFKYYDIPSPFPTLARGLFTRELEVGGEKRHKIVARGYDKFFNIGEVPWTTWASLEAHTKPPYTLTLKANGCIIFIAALTPTKLVVTSKHSLGPGHCAAKSHAMVGDRWLRVHLEKAGKTEEDLAKRLWENNWTAVAELCDDSFEEHVLRITPENTGLHLHGINQCSKEFKTMLPPIVNAFAREFGFIETKSTELQSIAEVKEFTERIGQEGKWQGEPLEGFVVRTHVSSPPTNDRAPASASPYAPGSSFFFKVKFDEPYMMYRDWREVTKMLLTKGVSEAKLPKAKMRRPETRAYVRWVSQEIKRDRKQFELYTSGRGIIGTRERFLKWFESREGKAEFEKDEKAVEVRREEQKEKFGKTVIVPVAIPGVGKTTIAVALTHLFGFGHTQSDDVKAKKPAPIFIKNVVNLLKDHDVVIADKNNHLRQHRQQLRDALKSFHPPVRLLGLYWPFDLPLSTVHRICGDRILSRGPNHQSLHGDALTKSHEEVIWQFLQNAEELDEAELDETIEMRVEESLEDALARAVDGCVRILGLPRPSVEAVGEALAAARAYAPKTKGEEAAVKKVKVGKPRYFALLPEVDLEELLMKRFSSSEKEEGKKGESVESGKAFFEQLKASKRIAARPHITLVHEKGLPGDQALWDRCKTLYELGAPPLFRFKLDAVVWDGRVMALAVSNLSVESDADAEDVEGKGGEFVVRLPEEVKGKLHITVGTKDKEINPFEARELVERWRTGVQGVQSCGLEDVWADGRVKGLYS